jgi:hypothetical protein
VRSSTETTPSGAKAQGDFASFTKVITQALACDLTRFGAFKMCDSGDPGQILVNQLPGLTNWSQSDNFHGALRTTQSRSRWRSTSDTS